MKRLRILAVGAALALTLAGCSSGEPAGDASGGAAPFRIVFISGLTGALQTPSQFALRSFEAAVDLMNDEGGIDGRQIVLDVGDSQSDPTRAVTLLQEKIAEGKPDLLWAGLSSGESLAMLPVATQEGIFSMLQASAPAIDDAAAYPYNFGVSPSSIAFWNGLPQRIEDDGIRKIVALLPQDGFGDGTVAALDKNLEGADVDLEYVRFNPQDIDFTVNWQQATDLDPDLIITDCFGDACPRLLASRTTAGAGEVPAIFGTGIAATGQGPASFAAPEDYADATMVLPSFMVYKSAAERSEAFSEFFDAVSATGEIETALTPALHPWDILKAAKVAYERSDTDDVEDLARQMYGIDEGADHWVSGWNLHWTEESHFTVAEPGDFVFAPIGPLKDGMFAG